MYLFPPLIWIMVFSHSADGEVLPLQTGLAATQRRIWTSMCTCDHFYMCVWCVCVHMLKGTAMQMSLSVQQRSGDHWPVYRKSSQPDNRLCIRNIIALDCWTVWAQRLTCCKTLSSQILKFTKTPQIFTMVDTSDESIQGQKGPTSLSGEGLTCNMCLKSKMYKIIQIYNSCSYWNRMRVTTMTFRLILYSERNTDLHT